MNQTSSKNSNTMSQTTSKSSNNMAQTASKKSNDMFQTASKTSGPMKKTKATKKSILGIDLGSTALRAALVECKAPYQRHPVQNTHVDAIQEVGAPMSAMGDFPVACCPLDPIDPLAKIGAQAVSEPGHISAKYLMYFLARIDPELMVDYPLPEDLMTHNEDEGFLEDCTEILSRLIKGVKERVHAIAQRKGLSFEEIILTIPAQWDTSFEDVYRPLVENVFTYTNEEDEQIKPKIHFCGEADALARYVILHEGRELEDWDVVLFLDFGGHSMSFSLMELKRTGTTDESGNTNLTFFELNAGGCAGGGEMWSHRVGQLISQKLREMGEEDADEEKKTKLLNCFNRDKFAAISRIHKEPTGVETFHCRDEKGVFTFVTLSREEIKNCFDAALAKPVEMAREQLMRLKGYSGDKKIGVVVAGGTLESKRARDLVFTDIGITEEQIKHTSDIDVQWLSSCNCIGAASAYAQKMTVAQFFEHGAVIALQQKTGPVHDASWEGFAYVLAGHNKKYVANVYNRTTGTKFRLVCNPNYAQNVTADQDEQDNVDEAGTTGNNDADTTIANAQTPIEDCYDLWHLGPQSAGKLEIEASLTSPSGTAPSEMTLHVSISRKNQQGTKKIKDIYLPLCLDPGHNAVHIDPEAISTEEDEQQAAWRREEENPEEPETQNPASQATEPAQLRKQTTKTSTEQGSEAGPSGSKKSSTAKKRKRKETNNAPSTQPSKRPRTRAVNSTDEPLRQLDYYAPSVPRGKRKATAPAVSSIPTKKARTDTAQDGEKTAEQPQEQPQAQEASQQDDEETHVPHDEQPDNNELDQTQQESVATASSSHTQPQPQQPPAPEHNNSNNNNNNVNGNTSRSTRNRNRNRTAANTRRTTATATATTRARTHTPTTTADRPAAPHTGARFEKGSSSPKRQRQQTEPPSEQQQQRGQPQPQPTQTQAQPQAEPRRSDRQQKGKSAVVASSTTTQPQRQQQQQPQQQPPQPQQQQQAQRTQQQQQQGRNLQARPRPPIRLELGPANRPAQPQRARSQAGPSRTQSQAQSSQRPGPTPTRTRQPAPPQAPRSRAWARQSDGEILDSITVAGRAERVITANHEEEEDKDKDKEKDKKDEEDEDKDLDNGDDKDDDGGDDDPDQGDGGGEGLSGVGGLSPELGEATPVLNSLGSTQLLPSFSPWQQPQQQQQQTSRADESSASGTGSGRRGSARARGQGVKNAAGEGSSVDQRVIIRRNPLPSSPRPQRQTCASASSRAQQGQQQAGGSRGLGSSRASAVERNKENEREQMIGAETTAVAGTGEPARRRPTREEKGKGKGVDEPEPAARNGEPARRRPIREEKGKGKAVDSPKPAPKLAPKPAPPPAPVPRPTATPAIAPRAFYGPGPSAAASSSAPTGASSSASTPGPASAGPSTAPASSQPKPKLKGKGKGKGKAQNAVRPAATTTTTTRTTTNPPATNIPPSLSSQFRLLRPRSPPPPPYPKPAVNMAAILAGGSRPSDLNALLASTATTPGQNPPPTPQPEPTTPAPVQSTDNGGTGTGTGTTGVGQTTPVPVPGYATTSTAGQGSDGDGTDREEDGRDESRDRRDGVEEGSRVLRSGRRSGNVRRNVHPYKRMAGESSSAVNSPAAAAAAVTPTVTASSTAGKKRARDGDDDDEGRASSSTRSQLQGQEEEDDEASRQPSHKKQRTEGGISSGNGSNGSNGSNLEGEPEMSLDFEPYPPEAFPFEEQEDDE